MLSPHFLLVELLFHLSRVLVLFLLGLLPILSHTLLEGIGILPLLGGLDSLALLVLGSPILLLLLRLRGLGLLLDLIQLLLHRGRQLRGPEGGRGQLGLESMENNALDLNLFEEKLVKLLQSDAALLILVRFLKLSLLQHISHFLVQHVLNIQVYEELRPAQPLHLWLILVLGKKGVEPLTNFRDFFPKSCLLCLGIADLLVPVRFLLALLDAVVGLGGDLLGELGQFCRHHRGQRQGWLLGDLDPALHRLLLKKVLQDEARAIRGGRDDHRLVERSGDAGDSTAVHAHLHIVTEHP